MQAYNTLSIPVEADDQTIDVRIPMTLKLLQEVEESLKELDKSRGWLRVNKEKTQIDVYREFAERYLPEGIERDRLQPAFFSLFFSRVSRELVDSLMQSIRSTGSTDGSPGPTDGKMTVEPPPPSPAAS